MTPEGTKHIMVTFESITYRLKLLFMYKLSLACVQLPQNIAFYLKLFIKAFHKIHSIHTIFRTEAVKVTLATIENIK